MTLTRRPLVLSILFLAFGFGQAVTPEFLKIEGLTIQNVDRTIDISSQLVQTTNKLRIENTGSSPAKFFIFTIEPEMKEHLSYIGATTGKDASPLKATVAQLTEKTNILVYKIDFPASSPLAVGKTVDVEVETVFNSYLTPFPSEISQKEKQFVKYIGNHYFYSPYKTSKQTTKITMPSRNVESFIKLKPFTQSDNVITFGAYEGIAPFSYSECIVHCENNNPFLTITKLERTIEVSHWGNVAVEEHIEILHTGAKLKVSKIF